MVEKNPQIVQAVVCAQKAAYEYMMKNQDEWVDTGRKLFGFDLNMLNVESSSTDIADRRSNGILE